MPCGDDSSTTSERYVKILDFRHFSRFWAFLEREEKGHKKVIMDGVNVSVVFDMVSGNTPEKNS